MDLTFLPPPATTSRARFTVRSASSPSYRPAACRHGGGAAVRLGTLAALTATTTRDHGKGRDVADTACKKTDARVDGVSQSETREDKGTLNGGMASAVGASQRDTGDGENSDRAERTTRLYQRNNSNTKSNGLERREEGPSSPERRSSGTGTLASSDDRDRVDVTTSPAGTGGASGDGRPSPGPSHAAAQQALDDRVSSGVKTQALDDRVSSGVKTQALDDRVSSSGVKTQALDDRVSSGVRTLPSRLKSRSMSGSTSGPRETTSVSLGPKGGQSIWERIEKLYGSTTTADDPARAMKRFSAPLDDWRLPSRLTDAAAAAARRNSTTTDFPLSAPVSPWGGRQSLRGSEDDGATEWGTAAAAGITMSLDRSRGRQSVAAQIRRARAAAEATAAAPPPDNTATAHRSSPQGEEDGVNKAARLSDPSGRLREVRRANGMKARAAERGGGEEAADVVGEGAKETATNDAGRVGEPEKDRRTDTENAGEANTLIRKGSVGGLREEKEIKEANTLIRKGSVGGLREEKEIKEANTLIRKASSSLREEKETIKEADTLIIRKGGGGSLREEKFKSVARKIHVKSTEAKKLVVPSVASVRNKISQYEALTQSALGSAGGSAGEAGKHQKPRRAFSVPSELGLLSAARDGPKDSCEWDRGVGRLRGRRWDDGGAGGSFSSARERATSMETTQTDTAGVRKSRSDRAIDELKTPNRTIDYTEPSVGGKKKTPHRTGRDEDGGGGSDRTAAAGIRGEPRDEEEERRRETRSTNAGSASTGNNVDPIPSAEELGDAGGGRTQTSGNLPVDRSCQRDVIGASARALSLPLCDSNNNNNHNNNDRGSRSRGQRTHSGDDDDATPTNPDDSPCFSDVAVTARSGDDAAAVSSGPLCQKSGSGSSPRQHHHILSSPPSCTTSTSAQGKLPHVVPSPLQVLSSGSVRNEGGADSLETCRVKSQGADSLETCRVKSQSADSLEACRVKSQGADSLETCRVTSQGADSLEACRVTSQGADSLEACRVKSQGADSLEACRVTSQGADSLEACRVTSQGADSLEACRVKSQGADSLETCRVTSQGADSLEACRVTSQGADSLEACRVKSQGADSLEACRVKSQGADSLEACRVKSQGADSLEACRVTSQGADSLEACRVTSQGADSLEACRVTSQGADSLEACRVTSQGADSLEAWVTSQGAAEDSLEAWVTTWNQRIQGWNDRDDDDDDDDGTEKDHDSNYDSDESSVTITSSQSDRRSFCVSLADLCNLGGVEYESESDSSSSEDWSNSLRSDMSALSYVSVMPAEELERLLQDVRGLGDSTLQSYEDVQVVVLHKDIGVGLGFSIAGGLDQNKPVTVHKVFPTGAAAQEGSVREGDHVLSINGSALCGSAHKEALRTLKRAKERSMGVVVLRRGAGRGGATAAATTAATAPYRAGEGGGVPASGASQQTPPPTMTGQRVCVRLEKRSRDLGFSLEGGVGSSLGDKPLSIQKIFHGGPGEQVCPGDQLLQIQDVSVVGMRRLEVWTLIKTLPPGPVDVVLHRPHKIPQT